MWAVCLRGAGRFVGLLKGVQVFGLNMCGHYVVTAVCPVIICNDTGLGVCRVDTCECISAEIYGNELLVSRALIQSVTSHIYIYSNLKRRQTCSSLLSCYSIFNAIL